MEVGRWWWEERGREKRGGKIKRAGTKLRFKAAVRPGPYPKASKCQRERTRGKRGKGDGGGWCWLVVVGGGWQVAVGDGCW